MTCGKNYFYPEQQNKKKKTKLHRSLFFEYTEYPLYFFDWHKYEAITASGIHFNVTGMPIKSPKNCGKCVSKVAE